MNAFQQFGIKDGWALIAGDDDTDNRAYIELAQASLWQAADFLNKVEGCSKCRFKEEINTLGMISDSLLGKYEATPKNLYAEDWVVAIVPMVKNWLGSAPERKLILRAGSNGRIVARLEADGKREEPVAVADPVNGHVAEGIVPVVKQWLARNLGQQLVLRAVPGGCVEVTVRESGKPDFEPHPVKEHVDDAATLEDTRDALGLARAMGSLLQLAESSASNYKLLNNAEARREELEAELDKVIEALGGVA